MSRPRRTIRRTESRIRGGNSYTSMFHNTARCPDCGKMRYPERSQAKRAIKILHPGEDMNVYKCGDFWHIGHRPHWLKED